MTGPDPGRVAEVFDALADLDPEDAERELDRAAGGDAALRDAVARLLAADRRAASVDVAPPTVIVAEAVREHEARAVAVADASEPTLPLGDEPGTVGSARLGRFFVLRKLGEGGMGVVYVGYDERLDRRIALKVMRRGAIAPDFLEREAQALGRLTHPNVVAVHEIGEDAGRVFVAMELVQGSTLTAWLAEARAFPAVLGMLLQAGRGLAAAHAAGLVHRDFKPDNVLVGHDGRARVVDFGIAALADAPERAAASPALGRRLTPAELSLGTPGYMAPEQIRGERATAASDQFAFAAALYRAVYRTYAFPVSDVAAYVERVLHGEPAPPPRWEDVPTWLWPVLRRGLARDPKARFPSMAALLDAIERHLPRDPDLDPVPMRRERLLGLVVLLAFVLLVGLCAPALPLTVRSLVIVSAAVVTVTLVFIRARWRRLQRNRFGRRMAGLFLGGLVAVLAHRLIALRLGTEVLHVLVGDLVVLATFYGVAAVTVERWLGWLAVLALTVATLSAFRPQMALTALIVSAVCSLSLLMAATPRSG